jgi:adenylate cyclase
VLPSPLFSRAACRGALVGLLAALVCWGLSAMTLVRVLDDWAFDACFSIRGSRPSEDKVLVVAMDDASLDEIPKPLMCFSPELAEVVAYLHERGAAAVGVDFLLPAGEQTMPDLLPGRSGDLETMGVAVARAGNVVLPEWVGMGNRRPPYQWYDESIPSARPWADLGFVDFMVDADSCVRRQELRLRSDRGYRPSLALALLAKARGLRHTWLDADELTWDGAPVPLGADGCLRINYVGPPGTIRTVPFREFLAAARRHAATPPSSCKDAIILLGMTAGAMKDSYPTPYATPSLVGWLRTEGSDPRRAMPGVEIHANVAATLLDRAFITTPWFLGTPLTLLIVGGALGAVLARCGLELGAIIAILHHVVWRGLAVGAFCLAGWRVEIVPMLILGVLLYGTIFALRWRWIRRMMGMVKSEAVARALEAGGAKLDLRGQQCEITVLFCDIRNFTPLAERRSPRDVVRLLNAFFTAAVPAIEAEGGTVNQYIGDAVMVLFGAPQSQPDHALCAVRAAQAIVARIVELRERWKELGAEDFRVGIGVHTGMAVVGTVGSPHRLDYTAIGDTVNTAARIESANKELGSQVLISETTFAALPDTVQRPIAAAGEPKIVALKGRQESLAVYVIA